MLPLAWLLKQFLVKTETWRFGLSQMYYNCFKTTKATDIGSNSNSLITTSIRRRSTTTIPFGSLLSNFGARANDFRQLLDSECANRFSAKIRHDTKRLLNNIKMDYIGVKNIEGSNSFDWIRVNETRKQLWPCDDFRWLSKLLWVMSASETKHQTGENEHNTPRKVG